MSQMEYNKGKLTPIGVDTEDFTEENFESYSENGYVVIDNDIYSVEWECYKLDEPPAALNVSVCDSTGVISFETYHYNGGAHWTEVIENAL